MTHHTKHAVYTQMKPSGTDWLGDIPSHWEVKKISWIYSHIGSGTTPDANNEKYYGGKTLWVTTSELREKEIYTTKKTLSNEALLKFSTLKIFPIDTILIAMYGATIGRLGILKHPATMNQACCAIAPQSKQNCYFLYLALNGFRQDLINLSGGAGQPNISQDIIKNFKIPLPPLSEQQEIVDYLDVELGRINRLSTLAKKSIDLLKQKKQSTITQTVTGKIKDKKLNFTLRVSKKY